jgi:hypothetical protein
LKIGKRGQRVQEFRSSGVEIRGSFRAWGAGDGGNSRAACLGRRALREKAKAPAPDGGRYKERKKRRGHDISCPYDRGKTWKTARVGGRITGVESGVLGGGAKFEGTCPIVQVY